MGGLQRAAWHSCGGRRRGAPIGQWCCKSWWWTAAGAQQRCWEGRGASPSGCVNNSANIIVEAAAAAPARPRRRSPRFPLSDQRRWLVLCAEPEPARLAGRCVEGRARRALLLNVDSARAPAGSWRRQHAQAHPSPYVKQFLRFSVSTRAVRVGASGASGARAPGWARPARISALCTMSWQLWQLWQRWTRRRLLPYCD